MKILRERMLEEIRGKVWVGIISALLFIAFGVYVFIGFRSSQYIIPPPSIISVIVSYIPIGLIWGMAGFALGYSVCSISNAIGRILKAIIKHK